MTLKKCLNEDINKSDCNAGCYFFKTDMFEKCLVLSVLRATSFFWQEPGDKYFRPCGSEECGNITNIYMKTILAYIYLQCMLCEVVKSLSYSIRENLVLMSTYQRLIWSASCLEDDKMFMKLSIPFFEMSLGDVKWSIIKWFRNLIGH